MMVETIENLSLSHPLLPILFLTTPHRCNEGGEADEVDQEKSKSLSLHRTDIQKMLESLLC